ncbi:MAG: hypothetical protein ACD_75C01444G0001 [uncultured bacterium]|nr:MAG: hypothetical protein ACD_75C01444G0001 [uncultured bacterium]
MTAPKQSSKAIKAIAPKVRESSRISASVSAIRVFARFMAFSPSPLAIFLMRLYLSICTVVAKVSASSVRPAWRSDNCSSLVFL